MHSTTIKITVLMSPAQKRRLARKAKAANVTMGELLRQGGERYSSTEDEVLLAQLAKQVAKATDKAIQSIDKALAFVAQSEARIVNLNKARKKH